jgi:hypothetical protein
MLLQGFKLSLQGQQFGLRPFLCFTTSGRCVLPAFRRFRIFVLGINTRADFFDIAVRPAGGNPIDGILFVFRNQLIKFFLSAGPSFGRLEACFQKLIKLLLVPYCLLLLFIAQLLAPRLNLPEHMLYQPHHKFVLQGSC